MRAAIILRAVAWFMKIRSAAWWSCSAAVPDLAAD
ncbi:MAG: hypothetical protein ACI89L_002828 [Phycisphaerales bacterium]|jgi:hypothetical protein